MCYSITLYVGKLCGYVIRLGTHILSVHVYIFNCFHNTLNKTVWLFFVPKLLACNRLSRRPKPGHLNRRRLLNQKTEHVYNFQKVNVSIFYRFLRKVISNWNFVNTIINYIRSILTITKRMDENPNVNCPRQYGLNYVFPLSFYLLA